MAIQVNINDLETWLSEQPDNTPETAYELEVTGLTESNLGELGWVLKNDYRYVDLSATSLPEGITDLYETFSFCTTLVNAPVIPSGVTHMTATFDYCISLVNAPVIPSSVINMSTTFHKCISLVNAPVIPNHVEGMNQTFYRCSSLVNGPVIPGSVITMQNTFDGCTSLATVTMNVLPSNLVYHNSTFGGTPSTLKIRVPEENLDEWKSITPSDWGLSSTDVFVELPPTDAELITLRQLKEYDVARNEKTTEKLDKKVDKGTQTTGNYVYTRDAGVEGQVQYGSATGATIMSRDSNGRTKVADIDSTSGGSYAANKNYVDGIANTKIDIIEKAAPNGVATLDANGHVPVDQMPTEALIYKGQWDASTGVYPVQETYTIGDFYVVSVEGDVETIHFYVGDWIIWNGTAWDRSANTNAVASVNGKTGVVELNASDLNAQETLVSGTNIKTINNESILGSGNLTIDPLPSGGTTGQVLTKTDSGADWQDASGDVEVTTSGTGNAVTGITADGNALTVTKGSTFVTIDTLQTIIGSKNFIGGLHSQGSISIEAIGTPQYSAATLGLGDSSFSYTNANGWKSCVWRCNNNSIGHPGKSGTIALTSDIPSVELNGEKTTSPSFYAPTSVGVEGQVLKTTHGGKPVWANNTIQPGDINAEQAGGLELPLISTNGGPNWKKLSCDGISSLENGEYVTKNKVLTSNGTGGTTWKDVSGNFIQSSQFSLDGDVLTITL